MDDGVFFGCGGVDVYNMTHGFTFVFVFIGEHVCCLVVLCANAVKHQCFINIQCDDDADADDDHASHEWNVAFPNEDSSKYMHTPPCTCWFWDVMEACIYFKCYVQG